MKINGNFAVALAGLMKKFCGRASWETSQQTKLMGWPSAWGQATPPSVLPALKMQGGRETDSTKRKVNPINTATWLSLNKRERHEHTVTTSPLGVLLTLNYLRSTAHPLLPQIGNVSSENFIRVHFLHVSEKDNSSSQNVMVIAHKGMRAKFIQYQLSISTRHWALANPTLQPT